MLEKFTDDARIGMIAGSNYLQDKTFFGDASYLFSGYAEQCGWATWRRAWRRYDVDMASWPIVRAEGCLDRTFLTMPQVSYWTDLFQKAHDHTGGFSSWAFPWLYMSLINGLVSVMPRENLITNVGFNREGTHVTSSTSPLANVPTGHLEFPLRHPPCTLRNAQYDEAYGRLVFYGGSPERARLRSWVAKVQRPAEVRGVLKEDMKRLRRHIDKVDLSSLEGTEPVSRLFGYDRGTPVDRYYMEKFLGGHSADIRGRVLEIGESPLHQDVRRGAGRGERRPEHHRGQPRGHHRRKAGCG